MTYTGRDSPGEVGDLASTNLVALAAETCANAPLGFGILRVTEGPARAGIQPEDANAAMSILDAHPTGRFTAPTGTARVA